MSNGTGFESTSPARSPAPGEGDPAWRTAAVSRASFGSSGRGRLGVRCPRGMAVPAPAGDVLKRGRNEGCSSSYGAPSWPNSMTAESSGGTNVLPTVALHRPKRGAQGGQDQEGQGYKVDGSGRWPGHSAGSMPGLGVPGRGDVAGEDAGDGGGGGVRARRAGPASVQTESLPIGPSTAIPCGSGSNGRG